MVVPIKVNYSAAVPRTCHWSQFVIGADAMVQSGGIEARPSSCPALFCYQCASRALEVPIYVQTNGLKSRIHPTEPPIELVSR